MSDRRHFLQTLFVSPSAIALAKERERVRIEQEHLAKTAQPSIPKPRCETCDEVLIKGKCPGTDFCNFCTQLLVAKIKSEGKREPNRHVISFGGRVFTLSEVYELKIYTHWVEDKCSECGNADLGSYYHFGSPSSFHHYGSTTCAIPSSSYLGYDVLSPERPNNFRSRIKKL